MRKSDDDDNDKILSRHSSSFFFSSWEYIVEKECERIYSETNNNSLLYAENQHGQKINDKIYESRAFLEFLEQVK